MIIVFKYFDKKYYFSHFIHMISTEPKEEKIKISSQNNFNRTFYTFNYTDYIENIITLSLKTKEIKKMSFV